MHINRLDGLLDFNDIVDLDVVVVPDQLKHLLIIYNLEDLHLFADLLKDISKLRAQSLDIDQILTP